MTPFLLFTVFVIFLITIVLVVIHYYYRKDKVQEITLTQKNNILDPSGKLRVSQGLSLIDVKQLDDPTNSTTSASLYWSFASGGNSTTVYNQETASVKHFVSGDGDFSIQQTKQTANYYSGNGVMFEATFFGLNHVPNVTKRVGLFSCNSTSPPFNETLDGAWMESDGETYRFKIHRNGTELLNVPQKDWNCDRLDGKGQSGIRFDPNATDVFYILKGDFLWLGGSSVRFWLMIDGDWRLAHVYNHSGTTNSSGTNKQIIMKNPNKPIRYEIRSTGGASNFSSVCSHVASEGIVSPAIGRAFSVSTTRNAITNNITVTNNEINALVGVRLRSDQTSTLEVSGVSIFTTAGNDDFNWFLLINPTITGTFAYTDLPNTRYQYAIGGDNTEIALGSKGYILAEGFGRGDRALSSNVINKFTLGKAINGTADQLVLAIGNNSGGGVTVRGGALNLVENN